MKSVWGLFFLIVIIVSNGSALIDLKEKAVLRTAHSDIITSLSFSMENRALITSGLDASIRFWDVTNIDLGRKISTQPFPQSSMWINVQASRRGNTFPVPGLGNIKLVTPDEGRPLGVLQLTNGNVKLTSVSVSPSGALTAAGFANGSVLIFDNVTRKSRGFIRHRSAVSALTFSSDEFMLASGDDEGQIVVWDFVSNPEGQGTLLIRHSMPIVFLSFYNEGKNLISASQDNKLQDNCRFWDLKTRKDIRSAKILMWTNQMLAVSPDEAYLAKANGKSVSFLNMSDMKQAYQVQTKGEVSAVAFSSDGKYFSAAMRNGDVVVYDVDGVNAEPELIVEPQILVLEPSAVKDSRGMKVIQATEGEEIKVSGVIGSSVPIDSVQINGISIPISIGSSEFGAQYNLRQKSIIQFSGKVTLPVGTQRIMVSAFNKKRQRLTDSVMVQVEAKQVAVAPPVEEKRRPEIHAFVVGISKYEENGYDLKYASDDAMFLAKKLKDERVGGVPPENITSIYDEEATRGNILYKLEDRLKSAQPNDIVLIYFACHGFGEKNEVYYMAYDTKPSQLMASGLRSSDVISIVKEHGSNKKVIMFLDACNSGGTGQQLASRGDVSSEDLNAFYEQIAQQNNFIVTMTASKMGELSYEGVQYGGGHGVFTYNLVVGLSGGANFDADKYITLGELYKFVKREVSVATNGKQNPTWNIGPGSDNPSYIPIAIVVK